MKYYSLTCRSRGQNFQKGERFYRSLTTLTIGQMASSEVRLPCPDDLLPQSFCTILPADGGWKLVKQTDYYPLRVNGAEVHYACLLHNADVISMDGVEFLFSTYDDDRYVEGRGLVTTEAKGGIWQQLKWITPLLVVIVCSLLYIIVVKTDNSFSAADNNAVRASVYKIVVEEIELQQHTPDLAEGEYLAIDSVVLDSVSVGTCFFTTDSLCVTARHCVEPWIDYEGWSDDAKLSDLPKPIQWAVLTEQSQQTMADTLYRVVSRCQVLDGDSCIYEFTSAECSFNRSRDIIVNMTEDCLPWRVIYPLYNRKDVELGDFAFLHTNRAGNLSLADEALLSDDAVDACPVRIYGFPRKNDGNVWEYQQVGAIFMPQRQDDHTFEGCIRLSVAGTSGFSGSPVIVKKMGRLNVVGVFSKIDSFDEGKNTYYAVPVNEITNYDPVKANEDDRPLR